MKNKKRRSGFFTTSPLMMIFFSLSKNPCEAVCVLARCLYACGLFVFRQNRF
jgi:hypothetical protein